MAGSSRYVRLVPCAVPGCSSVPTVLDSAAVSAAPSSSPNSLPRGSPAREEERRGSEAHFRFSRWATFTRVCDSVVRESPSHPARMSGRGCRLGSFPLSVSKEEARAPYFLWRKFLGKMRAAVTRPAAAGRRPRFPSCTLIQQ